MPFTPMGERRPSHDLLLVVAFAAVSGAVNSIGFVRLGGYVSHVTGTATSLGGALAARRFAAAAQSFALISAFGAGALVVGLLQSMARRLGRARHALGLAMEVGLLAVFVRLDAAGASATTSLSLLCAAMGLQNALGTCVAAVRSTHVTGIMTDLGLDVGRALACRNPSPDASRLGLHASTLAAFLAGAVAGAAGEVAFGAAAVTGPAAVLLGLASWEFAHAVRSRRRMPEGA